MTLAIILVIAAVLALVFILGITVSRSLQVSDEPGLAAQIQPIDIEAFRNLVDPGEDELSAPPTAAGGIPRGPARTLARHGRVRTSRGTKCRYPGRALDKPPCARRRCSDRRGGATSWSTDALLLRRNAIFALLRIHVALAWPNPALPPTPILDGYDI